MRELTFLETGCVMGLVALSLVLPILMSLRSPQNAVTRRACMKTVWLGQGLLSVAGAFAIFVPTLATYAAVAGLVSCCACAAALVKQSKVPEAIKVRR